jgi:CBS domain-containing protein
VQRLRDVLHTRGLELEVVRQICNLRLKAGLSALFPPPQAAVDSSSIGMQAARATARLRRTFIVVVPLDSTPDGMQFFSFAGIAASDERVPCPFVWWSGGSIVRMALRGSWIGVALLARRVGAVVVGDTNRVVGIFTERDVLKKLALSGRDEPAGFGDGGFRRNAGGFFVAQTEDGHPEPHF